MRTAFLTLGKTIMNQVISSRTNLILIEMFPKEQVFVLPNLLNNGLWLDKRQLLCTSVSF